MSVKRYTVTRVPGLKVSDRRAILFLQCDQDPDIDAILVFKALKGKDAMNVLTRFDHWIDRSVFDKYHHGWPNNPTYKNCYVFKWNAAKQHHRLYGFLCHPTPVTEPRFQVCVLVSHGIKKTWETDPRELDGANALRLNSAVLAAIRKLFPEDKKESNKQWPQ